MNPQAITILVLIYLGLESTLAVETKEDTKPHEDYDKLIEECSQIHKVSATAAMGILHMEDPADTPEEKCFVKCFAEKLGVVNKIDGKYIPTALLEKNLECFDAAKLPEAIKKCETPTGTNPCEITYDQTKCLMKEAGKPKEEKKSE